MSEGKDQKKRPGPKPELISLYPFTFDEVLDTVLSSKPKKEEKERDKKVLDKAGAKQKRKPA